MKKTQDLICFRARFLSLLFGVTGSHSWLGVRKGVRAAWLCEGPRSDFWMSHAGCSPDDPPLEGGQVAKASRARALGKGMGKETQQSSVTAWARDGGTREARTVTQQNNDPGGPCRWHPSHP